MRRRLLAAAIAPALPPERLKPQMVRVGDFKTFENFVVPVPAGIDPSRCSAVIVWCGTSSQFTTARCR